MIIKLNPTEKGICFEATIKVNPHDLIVISNPQNREEIASRTNALEADMHIVVHPQIAENGAYIKIVSDPETIIGTQNEINVHLDQFVDKVKKYGEFIGNLAKEFETRRNEESELKLITPDMMFDDTLFETESGKKLLNALRKSVEQEEKSFDNYDDFIDSLVDKIKKVSNSGVGGTFVIQIPKRYDKKCN